MSPGMTYTMGACPRLIRHRRILHRTQQSPVLRDTPWQSPCMLLDTCRMLRGLRIPISISMCHVLV